MTRDLFQFMRKIMINIDVKHGIRNFFIWKLFDVLINYIFNFQ